MNDLNLAVTVAESSGSPRAPGLGPIDLPRIFNLMFDIPTFQRP